MFQLISKIVREDNFLSLMGNLIIAVLGLGGFALLARSLNADQFAQWVLFISGGSLVEMIRFGITNNGLVRFLSGASNKDSAQLIGSNVLISLVATTLIATLLIIIKLVFNEAITNSGYNLFFTWYPILAFINLAWNNATVVLQAKMEYGKILTIKAINSGLFFSVLIINIELSLSVEALVMVLLVVNLTTSLVCIVRAWDGLNFIRKANKLKIKTLLNFGKYSTFTLIGTNLLRNADILIISISPFGSEAVALFSIPLKLTELQQIPLRSFAATAFPKMSKASLEGKVKEVQHLFYTYSGALTYLFLLISTITFVFAEEFVILISGDQYLNAATPGFNIVTIVRILSVYGLLLPIDRMTGIGLDSINKPNINALKVSVMLGANIIGDIIAVFVFESLEMVAVSTLVFTTVGILLGVYFLNKEFRLSSFDIIKSANRFYRLLWFQVKGKINEFNLEKSY
jgi:O-antigen/teichoic acid export membrane protein